jgi:transposase
MPRPSKLTDDLQTQIVRLIRAGSTVEVAAQSAGVAKRTFYSWMERGAAAEPKRADAPYAAFRDAVDQAHAESEAMLVTRIAKAAGDGSWAAAAWLLERRWPQRWSKPAAGAVETPKVDPGTLRLVAVGEEP